MPLYESQLELTATPQVLQALLDQPQSIEALAERVRARAIRQIVLVGSGDSYAVAQIAAHYLEQQSQLICRAWQTYQFLVQPVATLDQQTLVILISASGRPSPILDALHYAITLPCMVVGITNQPGNPFQQQGDDCLFTGASKRGMPTQSSSATLLLLYQLAESLRPNEQDSPSRLPAMVRGLPAVIAQSVENCRSLPLSAFFDGPVLLLGGGITAGVAMLGSNLLACGPQLAADHFIIEEYHHSLRLYPPQDGRLFLLLPDQRWPQGLWQSTCATLLDKGARVVVVDPRQLVPELHHSRLQVIRHAVGSEWDIAHSLFYSMAWWYELALQLGQLWVQQGGRRAALNQE